MSNKSQEVFTHGRDNDWGLAITEAERQIREAEERIKKLRISLEAFREFQRLGQTFPGPTPDG